MKTDDRLRIVHASDIHFCSSFDRPLWEQVKSAIKAEEPDILVVSGDFVESPFPLMLILARREMKSFAELLGVPLVTVPGNHDVAFAGIIRIWPFSRLFRAIFSGHYDKKALKIFPTFTDFYRNPFLVRMIWRVLLYVYILCLWPTRFAWCRGTQDEVLLYPGVMTESKKFCTFVGIDTNRSHFLAAGKVAKAQLANFGSTVLGFKRKDTLQKALECRILVMHHHPIPIPYMSEGTLEFEPFLVLRNAGTVLSEVWSSGFDLILHGHRHRSCFSRIAYGDGTQNPRTIPVLAAASPSVEATSASGNSFNMIDVYPNGRLLIRVQSYGGGVNIRGGTGDAPTSISGLGFEELKVRNFHRAVEVQGAYCDEYRRDVLVSHLGTTTTKVEVKNFIATHATVESHPHRFKVDLGLIDPTGICLYEESPGVALLPLGTGSVPSNDVIVKVGVPPANAGSPVSYGISYTTANNFRLSKWECSEEKRKAEESISFRVKYPAKRLVLRVELPINQYAPKPLLRCWRPKNFANLLIDKESRIVNPPSGDADEWVSDYDATVHEATNLTKIADQVWQLTIAFPMVGYKYEIAWKVKDVREVETDARYVGETIAFRQLAVEYRSKRLNSAITPRAGVNNVVYLLHLLLNEFGKHYQSRDVQRETLRACLFTYDAAAQLDERVIGIEEVVVGPRRSDESDPARLAQYKMQFGEGVAGLSLKTAHPNVYFKPDGHFESQFDTGYFELANKLGIKGVVAIPLYHPKKWLDLTELKMEMDFSGADVPSIYETIGVITFSSDSPGTGIARLCGVETDRKAKREAMLSLTRLMQDAVPLLHNYLLSS
jgi:3',5'-cyclic AMP phosphodiesterase CpdA